MIKARECIFDNRHSDFDLENWQEIVNLMASIFDAASGDIVQLRDDEFNVVSSSKNDDNFLAEKSTWSWDMKSFCREMVETGESIYVADAETSAYWYDAPPVCEGPVRSYLGYPLYWPNGDVFGSICVIDTKPTNYTDDLVILLGQLKKLIEANLRHADDLEQLRYSAFHDPLTGCGNRLLMHERLNNQIARVQRQNESFSLISIDLDNFKPVNDDYGHQMGDVALKEVVARLQASIRESDLLVRLGGDEFLVIFSSEVNLNQTICKLDSKIKKSINFEGITLNISASFGSGSCPHDGTSSDKLLAIVDQRMYTDKKSK